MRLSEIKPVRDVSDDHQLTENLKKNFQICHPIEDSIACQQVLPLLKMFEINETKEENCKNDFTARKYCDQCVKLQTFRELNATR